jgi:hypothetical protein
MSTHTPTPWRLLDNTGGQRSLVHIECEETLAPVCSIPKKRIADAAFIVRAVNSHAQLLEALKLANELLDNSDVRHYIGHDLGEMSQLHKALNTSRAAIAQAEGKE